MVNIDPNELYDLQKVVDLKLIPHINGYAKMYEMVHIKVPDANNKTGFRNELAIATTKQKIKPLDTKAPWNKIAGKVLVEGSELIKFLRIHNLI